MGSYGCGSDSNGGPFDWGSSGTDVGSGSADGGGGDSSGAPTLALGLDDSKLLVDLTDDERAAACEALEQADVVAIQQEFGCALLAVVSVGFGGEPWSAEACQASYDDCIASDGGVSECNWDTLLPDCTGTVADYEACVQSSLDTAVEVIPQFDCAIEYGGLDLASLQATSACDSVAGCFEEE